MPHRTLVGLFILLIALAGCGDTQVQEEDCRPIAQTYKDAMRPHFQTWNTTVVAAAGIDAAELAPFITNLQSIRRDVDGVSVPACVGETHGLLTRAMDTLIAAEITYTQTNDRVLFLPQYNEYFTTMGSFTRQLNELIGY